MAITIQLLKQLRRAAASINQTTDNPEHKALLASADQALNEMMLQESPAFYLNYVESGKQLLAEGNAMARKNGVPPPAGMLLRNDLSAEHCIAAIRAEIDKLHFSLEWVVAVLDEGRSAEEKDYLIRLCDWESTLYAHSLEQVDSAAANMLKPLTKEALQAYLQQKFPQWTNLKVTKFMRLDGGFSKTTILFETDDAVNGPQSLVMRAEQAANMLGYEGSDVRQEFYMIKLMQQAGLPIADPLWLEDDQSKLGMRFIVSRKAVGGSYGGNFGSDKPLPPELLQNIMSTFIKMHNIKVDPADPLAQKSHLREWLPHVGSVKDATRHLVTEFMPRLIKLTDLKASPQLLRGLKWLEKNIPDIDEAPTVVHIDFAFNNLIIDGNQITAVLDWESSRLGDPAEDVIWTQFSLNSYLSMPDFLKQYEAATGRKMTEFRLAYYRVSKCALNAISCLSSARAIDSNDGSNFNLTILGYKYMSIFGSQFNTLIAEAEKVRGR